jgi:hypothetical protein
MSLGKAVPDGLKDHKCKKIALRKCPPIPYVPNKDSVHKTVSTFKENHIKTQISKEMELQVPIWHSNMCEAFLIHLGSAMEAIERKGFFKAYIESNEAYVKQRSWIKLAKAQLAELDDSTNKGAVGKSKKSTKKSNVTTAEASPTDSALQAKLVSEIKWPNQP